MSGAKARPSSAQSQSKTAWGDYGGHARPDSQFEFEGIRNDPDLSPSAMDDDSVYTGGDKGKGKSGAVASSSSNKKSQSCLGKIGSGIRSLWATRQTEDVKGDRELHVKTTLRELIIYIVFLVILCIVTFGMTGTTMYYYTKVMSDLFLDTSWSGGGTFRTVTSVEDFWKFAKGPLVKGLYWETWYNNDLVPNDQLGYIYYENKLLGVPRIRQLQVHSNSCVVHDDFKDVIRECYESYAESLENKESFGEKDNYTGWYYRTQDELDGSSHWGLISTYSGAGYVQDLKRDKNESEAIIEYLFDKRWIRRGTRVLFIDFTVYNANINLFCVIRLAVEFPATGGAITQATMRTVKLIRYVTVMDYFILACEFILCVFILYYMVEEAIEIKKHKFSYFKSVWNILDILVISITIMCVVFNVYRTVKVDSLLEELLGKPDQYADFEFLSYGQTQFDNAIAIAVFLAWIKIFKYISFNKTMTQLSSTLGKCAKDLAGFAVMFFIIFLAFTQLGYLLFGTQVKDFSNFKNSFFTLFRIILGDFDFDQLEAANRVLGPIFFMMFVFFVFFVLINMFLAIINDTYSEVKGDMANQKNEFEMTDYFKRGYEKMLNKLNFKHDKIVDIQKALHSADINNDKQVDFDEWRQDLKTRGYADAEIEALFAKYDIDGDRVLDEEEQRRMQADLNDQKHALTKEYDELDKMQRPESARRSTSRVSFNDDSADDSDDEDSHTKSSRSGPSQGVQYEEFTVLSRRVDRMEHSIGSIVSKIDAVLVKLEAMEKAKLKRRETMGKILDSITEKRNTEREVDRRPSEASDGTSDEVKREQMEKLVREELERWDSESSVTPQASGRGASPSSSGRGGARSRSGGNAPIPEMTPEDIEDTVIPKTNLLYQPIREQFNDEIMENTKSIPRVFNQPAPNKVCKVAEAQKPWTDNKPGTQNKPGTPKSSAIKPGTPRTIDVDLDLKVRAANKQSVTDAPLDTDGQDTTGEIQPSSPDLVETGPTSSLSECSGPLKHDQNSSNSDTKTPTSQRPQPAPAKTLKGQKLTNDIRPVTPGIPGIPSNTYSSGDSSHTQLSLPRSPSPSTTSLNSSTPSLNSSTPSPKSSTPSPKLSVPSPKLSTPSPNSSTPSPNSSTPNPKSSAPSLNLRAPNPNSETFSTDLLTLNKSNRNGENDNSAVKFSDTEGDNVDNNEQTNIEHQTAQNVPHLSSVSEKNVVQPHVSQKMAAAQQGQSQPIPTGQHQQIITPMGQKISMGTLIKRCRSAVTSDHMSKNKATSDPQKKPESTSIQLENETVTSSQARLLSHSANYHRTTLASPLIPQLDNTGNDRPTSRTVIKTNPVGSDPKPAVPKRPAPSVPRGSQGLHSGMDSVQEEQHKGTTSSADVDSQEMPVFV